MYDELKKRDDNNPTIGIVLCGETDKDIARYSILHGNEQLFASKYKLYLPNEDELRREISRQKAMFPLQQKEKAVLKEVDADELIQELCPNGVEYQKILDIEVILCLKL